MRIEDLRIGMKVYIDATGCGVLTVSKLGVAGFFTEKWYFNYKCSWIDWGKTASLNDLSAQEQSQYTFDDLIDVARKAFDDEMLRHLSQSIDPVKELKITTQDGVCIEWVDNLNDYLPSINFIQSLYKETFVIESEEDIKRVKDGAKITLVNGNESYVCALNDPADSFCVLHSDYNLDMFTLKGATVEQDRNV